jgi:hypothetical protein
MDGGINDLSGIVNGLFFFAVFGAFYMLPSILAANRCMANRWSIFFLNLFLGWTLVGWVVSLCWSVAGTAIVRDVPPPPRLV